MNATSKIHSSLMLITALSGAAVLAATSAVCGDWTGPSGSVIRIAPCGKGLCVEIVGLPPGDHSSTDVHNANPSLRSRPLCGLRIGEGFILKGPERADDGRIYDPRSGRTYHATMRAEGERLELRGFVGARLFGRTEIWHRARGTPPSCGRG